MISTTITTSLFLALLTPFVSAHLQLTSPYPLHSKFNPNTPEALKDYSMTSPLTTDGTQYPCKGYINNPSGSPAMDSVQTIAAGSVMDFSLAGTATHGGGSCQISMSYDMGASWNVIHSIIGGCMIEGMDLNVNIPSEAPSGEALFSWSWFNHEGNREMYQNCAVITVTGGGSGLTGPTPFVANVGVNQCATLEGIDVVFPEPGSSVSYGGAYASSKPTTAAGFTGSNCIGPGATSSGSTSSVSSTPADVSASASASTSTVAADPTTIASSSTAAVTTSTAVVVAHAAVTNTSSTTSTAKSTAKCNRRRRRSHSRDLN